MKMRLDGAVRLAVVLIGLGSGGGTASGQTVGYWTNTVSGGSWTTAANWTNCPGTYPQAAGDVAYFAATQAVNHVVYLGPGLNLGSLWVENDGYAFTSNTLTFDRGGAGARLTGQATAGSRASTTLFNSPVVLVDDLLVDWSGETKGVQFPGGFSGASNRVLTILHNPSVDTDITFGITTGFLGRVDLYRTAPTRSRLGVNFSATNQLFGGPPGSIRAFADVLLGFGLSVTPAILSRFSFPEQGNVITLGNSGSFTNVPFSQNYVFPGGGLYLNNPQTLHTNRWPDADPVPLVDAGITLQGWTFNASVQPPLYERIGDTTFEGGCRMSVANGSRAYSISGILPLSLTRAGRGTMLFTSTGGGAPFGTTISNVVRVTGAVTPSMTNGMCGPWFAHVAGATEMGDFLAYGANGLTPVVYDLTNDFTAATLATKVTVSSTLNLGGGTVMCHALRSSVALTDGTVVIGSGGLSAKAGSGAPMRAHLMFGTAGDAEAVIVANGNTGASEILSVFGNLACSNLTKYGNLELRLNGTNTALRGSIWINEGSLRLDRPSTINPYNDVMLRYLTSLTLNTTNIAMGGLSGTAKTLVVNGTSPLQLSLNPAAGTTNVFAGNISNNAALFLTLAGPGCQVLSAANTYGGATTVNAGTLLVDGYLASTSVVVNTGGTLGGTGKLAGALTVVGGTLSAGGPDRAGMLTVSSNVTLGAGAVVAFDLGQPGVAGGASNDLVVVNGDLTLDGTLNVSALGALPRGSYRLFTVSGQVTDNGLSLGVLPGAGAGDSYRVVVGANAVDLALTPAAGTVLLLR